MPLITFGSDPSAKPAFMPAKGEPLYVPPGGGAPQAPLRVQTNRLGAIVAILGATALGLTVMNKIPKKKK